MSELLLQLLLLLLSLSFSWSRIGSVPPVWLRKQVLQLLPQLHLLLAWVSEQLWPWLPLLLSGLPLLTLLLLHALL